MKLATKKKVGIYPKPLFQCGVFLSKRPLLYCCDFDTENYPLIVGKNALITKTILPVKPPFGYTICDYEHIRNEIFFGNEHRNIGQISDVNYFDSLP